jgi:hypothetical protein
MKKVMMILGISMLAGLTSSGQSQARTRSSATSLGPVAGFGHSWVSGMNNADFKPSAQLGVGFIHSRHANWAWGANLVASHEGYSYTNWMNGQQYNYAVDPTYLRLTPRAYYFIGPANWGVRPKVYAGPSLGLLLAEDRYIRNETMGNTDVAYGMNDNQRQFRTLDFGGEVGTGVNVKLGGGTWLNLDGSYYNGFTNATMGNDMNRNLRFNVGVMMGL